MYPFKIIVYSLLAVPGFALPGARENIRQTIHANSFGVPGEDASFDYVYDRINREYSGSC